jgi:hypothetical protein
MLVDIDRHVLQPVGAALKRLKFCLDCLENQGFVEGIDWSTLITDRLTMEEVIGALVSAEQELKLVEYETRIELGEK